MNHKMNRTSTFILSASCLIAVAGLAIAQPQNTPARQSVQTAERLSQMRGSLHEAIRAAEQHSNGTAIGARLSMNWTAFQQESMGQHQMGQQRDQWQTNEADRERIEREIREQNPNLSREQVSTQARERMERESRDRTSNQWSDQDDRQNLERIEREIREQNPNLSREQVATQARERIERENRERTGNQPNYQDDRQNRERIEREIRQQNPSLSRDQVATQARERIEREIRDQIPNLSREQVSTQARERLERENRERNTNRPSTQDDRQNLERIEREIRDQNPNLSREQVSTQARERLERENRDGGATAPAQPIRGVSDGSNLNAPIDPDHGGGQDQWTPGSGQDQRSPEFTDSRGDSLFAVITCVVDESLVREVIVDMRNNSVVGVYAMDALRDGSYADESSRYEREANQTRSAANVRATDLMNATARDAAGKRLGDIDELVIDPDSNRVIYAVLRRGGFLGMGESRFAIPATELSIPHEDRMHLSLSEADFEGQAGFENNNWPLRADSQWSRTEPQDGAPTTSARRITKATDIIGSGVKCRDGRDLGNIKDLVVEPRSGRIVYAIVNTTNGYLPVPMSVLTAKDDGYSMPMAMNEIQTRPRIQANRDPNWNDTAWNRTVYESYGLTIDERYPSRARPTDER